MNKCLGKQARSGSKRLNFSGYISVAQNIPVSPVFHNVVTVNIGLKNLIQQSNKHLTLLRLRTLFGRTRLGKSDFQIEGSDLINLLIQKEHLIKSF